MADPTRVLRTALDLDSGKDPLAGWQVGLIPDGVIDFGADTYSSMDSVQVAAAFNVEDREYNVPVPMPDLVKALMHGGSWSAIKIAAADVALDAHEECEMFLDIVAMPEHFPTMDLSDAANIAIMGAILAAGYISVSLKNEIMAMATNTQSLAKEIVLPSIQIGHVDQARSLK